LITNDKQGKNYIIDSYDGKILVNIIGYDNELGENIQSCFTPDGEYILSGSENGIIHVYRVHNGDNILQLRAHPKQC